MRGKIAARGVAAIGIVKVEITFGTARQLGVNGTHMGNLGRWFFCVVDKAQHPVNGLEIGISGDIAFNAELAFRTRISDEILYAMAFG